MYASAVGNDDFALAGAEIGSSSVTSTGDIATIIGNSSDAYAGAGSYDFAGVLGEMLTSTATGGNFLFDLMLSLDLSLRLAIEPVRGSLACSSPIPRGVGRRSCGVISYRRPVRS